MVHAAPVQKDALSTLRCVLQTSWNLFIVFGADKECSEKKYRVCFKHYIYKIYWTIISKSIFCSSFVVLKLQLIVFNHLTICLCVTTHCIQMQKTKL